MTTENIPLPAKLIDDSLKETGFSSDNLAIREVNRLVNILEDKTGINFIRMEFGIPNIPPPDFVKDAEQEAMNQGVHGAYPPFDGIPELKQAGSHFFEAFFNVKISTNSIIPTCGSMQGGFISQQLAGNLFPNRKKILFLDPTFPVSKLQARFLGLKTEGIDIYDCRGDSLLSAIREKFEEGNIGGLLWSSPNNPSWVCLRPSELQGIAELCDEYKVLAIEDQAYIGMDFRQDYSTPFTEPFIPSVAQYGDYWVTLISSSKAFSYPGPRCAISVISPALVNKKFTNLKEKCGSETFGHSFSHGGLYVTTSGVSHASQYGLTSLLNAACDGSFNFVEHTREYSSRSENICKIFTNHGFNQVYKTDIDVPVGNGFFLTMSYPKFTGNDLLKELLRYGISTTTLSSSGSSRDEGLRICVSFVKPTEISLLEQRLKYFEEDHT